MLSVSEEEEEEEDDDDDDDDEEESSEDDSDSDSEEEEEEEEEVENDTGNGTDTANTIITRPDEDTAPAPTPTLAPAPAPATEKEKETAATTADPLDPVCMFGPYSTIPENIRGILDEWHKKNPTTVPPCSYRSGIPKQAWKVFDRNGKEVPFALFMIKRPISYKITFISNEDGSGKLVACRPYSPFQIFLIGWNGLVDYDEEACAVRLFGRNLDDIVFTPGCFDKAPGPKPEAATTGATANSTSTEKNTTRSHKRGGRRSGRKNGTGNGTARSTQRRKPEDETISGSIPENASSNESPQSEREDISARPTKRSRNSTSDAALPPPPAVPATPASPKTTPPNTHEVAFKLVSELSDATRCFPITECKSSRDLFAKARKFFRLLDGDLEVNFLSCRIPSKHERRYLFEGSQGEFNLLIHDVRNLQGIDAKTLIIEVKCME